MCWIPDKVPLRSTFPGMGGGVALRSGRQHATASDLHPPHPPQSSRPQRSGEPGSPSGEDGTCRAEIPGRARDDGEIEASERWWAPEACGENSPTPHPEEQARLGLRLEGRGSRWPRWSACWNPSSFETRCAAASLPGDEGEPPSNLSTPPCHPGRSAAESRDLHPEKTEPAGQRSRVGPGMTERLRRRRDSRRRTPQGKLSHPSS